MNSRHQRVGIRGRAGRLALALSMTVVGAAVAAPTATAAEPTAITLAKPTISGDAVVDGLLVAQTTVDPSDATLAYSWKAASAEVATTSFYRPTPADVGKTITVTVTASYAGLADRSRTSDPTAAVEKATFTSNYAFSITGKSRVGSTLTVDVNSPGGVVAPNPTGSSLQWLRDGSPIGGATGQSYVLVSADLGTSITLAVTVTRAGYNDLTVTSSNAIGPIRKEIITLNKPKISGDAVVDGLLIANVGTVTPSGTSLAYSWKSDSAEVATTSFYRPTPADVGKTITVTVTASKAGLADQSKTSNPTAPVEKADFTSDYRFRISGKAMVGNTLTVDVNSPGGVVSPTPTGTSFQWLRDGSPIGGATSESYGLVSADLGTTITLAITVTRDGYNDLTITSKNAKGPVLPGA